jgi:hypothetical protein
MAAINTAISVGLIFLGAAAVSGENVGFGPAQQALIDQPPRGQGSDKNGNLSRADFFGGSGRFFG